MHGRKSLEEIREYYELADALLITLRGNNFVGNTLPGKMQTYLTVGKPIFGAINGAGFDVIKVSKSGDCVNSGDYQGLAKIMNDYILNPDKYVKCGEYAKTYYINNFSKKIFFEKLEEILKEIS